MKLDILTMLREHLDKYLNRQGIEGFVLTQGNGNNINRQKGLHGPLMINDL